MRTLNGPYAQVITFKDAPLKGPLKNGSLAIIENAGILSENGKILAVGPFRELVDKAEKTEKEESRACVFPGFIDCHTHLIWGGSRAADFERRNSGFTYQEILKEGGGIFDTVQKTREATDEELKTGLSKRIRRHLNDGITTVEIKSGYGISPEHEIRLLKLIRETKNIASIDIVSTFLGAHVSPKHKSKEAYLQELTEEALPVISELKLAGRVDAFVEPEAFPVEIVRPFMEKVRSMGFRLTLHVGQFTPDGVKLACQLNALSADHLESITDKEIDMLAKSDTMGVALPGASLGLGMGFTPARKILDRGGSLAIATDWNPGSAPQGDLLAQSSLLATYEKLSSAEIFAGITYRAANALGLSDRGRIKTGMLADFVVFPTADYREVLYQMGRMSPVKVYKNGNKIN